MKKFWRFFLTVLMLMACMVPAGAPAGTPAGDQEGLEPDDPDEPDDDADDDDSDDEDEGDEPEPDKDKPVTQEEIDRIVESRLARERVKFEKQLADVKAQQQTDQTAKQQQAQDNSYLKQIYATEYQAQIEAGVTEQQAASRAQREVDREARSLVVDRRQQASDAKAQQFERRADYSDAKTAAISETPYVAKYLKEIDEFSGKGALVDFPTAMAFVVGQKVLSGELGTDMRSAAEQATLKNVNARGKKKVEGGTSAGGAGDRTPKMSPSEMKYAKALGVKPEEYVAAKSKNRRKK
jgi:hypothetical protein